MIATSLAHLRAELRQRESAYRAALRRYFAAHVDRRDLTVIFACLHECHHHGTTLMDTLDALLDALRHETTALRVDQHRLQERRRIIAEELRLLRR